VAWTTTTGWNIDLLSLNDDHLLCSRYSSAPVSSPPGSLSMTSLASRQTIFLPPCTMMLSRTTFLEDDCFISKMYKHHGYCVPHFVLSLIVLSSLPVYYSSSVILPRCCRFYFVFFVFITPPRIHTSLLVCFLLLYPGVLCCIYTKHPSCLYLFPN
jgi:hypothetical protein